MSKKILSAFAVSHGSIDDQLVSEYVNEQDVTVYESRINFEILPEYTTLYMPNILGKPYFLSPTRLNDFITNQIREWDRKHTFSEYIANELKEFEERQCDTMFKLLDESDILDAPGYDQGFRMPLNEKEKRRTMREAAVYKVGIEWKKPDHYMFEKKYNLPANHRPGEGLLIIIEEIHSNGRRTISEILRTDGREISGRLNLAEVATALRSLERLKLKPTDEICVFDFVCNTPNFQSNRYIAQYYNPDLLSCHLNPDDDGATMTYGTILKEQSEQFCLAETLGQTGVGYDDSPRSLFDLDSYSQSSGASQNSDVSLPTRATPLLQVRVPREGISLINFRADDLPRSRTRSRSGSRSGSPMGRTSPIDSFDLGGGGKRKYTKRKRNLKRSYRKRYVTRVRYDSRRRRSMKRESSNRRRR